MTAARLPISDLNTVRRQRSVWKQRLQRGEVHVNDVLLAPPACLTGIKLYDLLKACRWLNETRARDLLRLADLEADARLRDISLRDRRTLATILHLRYPRIGRPVA